VAELRAAVEVFERVGARPYVERCERDVAGSSLASRRQRRGTAPRLTRQETSVARLVAQGKTNQAVADALVVSVNTIEYHLKNVYAKLGIHSRSELTLRVATSGDDLGLAAPAG
jgi:DNA-binding NarL/FixJ family response regulator